MIVTTLLIAVSVSMDAFAVSIGKGLATRNLRMRDAASTALWFGGFQALFPILGYLCAAIFGKYVEAVDHWIIFALLTLIGANMIKDAFTTDGDQSDNGQFDWKHMLPLAVACSIDAFAVGISIGLLNISIWFAALIIGLVTAGLSAAGLYIGHIFGTRWQKPAQIAGGIILILLGTKILLEHLGVISW